MMVTGSRAVDMTEAPSSSAAGSSLWLSAPPIKAGTSGWKHRFEVDEHRVAAGGDEVLGM